MTVEDKKERPLGKARSKDDMVHGPELVDNQDRVIWLRHFEFIPGAHGRNELTGYMGKWLSIISDPGFVRLRTPKQNASRIQLRPRLSHRIAPPRAIPR